MSTHPGRVRRGDVERILSSTHHCASPTLRPVLRAASAPARPDELRGESAAVAQFRAAGCYGIAEPQSSRSLLKTTVAKLFAAKVLVGIAVAGVASGGVALAAATNHVPNPLARHHAPPAASAHGRTTASAPDSTHAHSTPATRGTAADQSESKNTPNGTPSPSLVGLCTAYQAGVSHNRGKALENPAFSALIAQAGGTSKVAGYCTTVLASAHGNDAASKNDGASQNGHASGNEQASKTHNIQAHPTQARDEPNSGSLSVSDGPTTHPSGPQTPPPAGN